MSNICIVCGEQNISLSTNKECAKWGKTLPKAGLGNLHDVIAFTRYLEVCKDRGREQAAKAAAQIFDRAKNDIQLALDIEYYIDRMPQRSFTWIHSQIFEVLKSVDSAMQRNKDFLPNEKLSAVIQAFDKDGQFEVLKSCANKDSRDLTGEEKKALSLAYAIYLDPNKKRSTAPLNDLNRLFPQFYQNNLIEYDPYTLIETPNDLAHYLKGLFEDVPDGIISLIQGFLKNVFYLHNLRTKIPNYQPADYDKGLSSMINGYDHSITWPVTGTQFQSLEKCVTQKTVEELTLDEKKLVRDGFVLYLNQTEKS